MSNAQDLVPISSLFYDGPGPHVVRAGFLPARPAEPAQRYTPARGQELRALLDTSISQLRPVSGAVKRKTPTLPLPVAIETLLYRGRAALARALEVREEIVSSQDEIQRDKLDELLDLVALAATE
jgi:hypothetical protein